MTLDDSVERWEVAIPNAAEIRIRQLLNHTSGLADYQHHERFRQRLQEDPSRIWTVQEIVDSGIELGPVGSPGAKHAYSNTNYFVAMMIAEAASGEPYVQLLRSREFQPANLEHTFLEGVESLLDPSAVGYLVESSGAPFDNAAYYHASQAGPVEAIVIRRTTCGCG